MGGERRKDYMVSKRVHLLYMLTWLASLLLVGSLVIMAYTLRETANTVQAAGKTPFILVGVLAFVIVCSALLLAVYTIIHTHRLMGSAYRIGVVLKEINAGQPSRVTLREGDFFGEIADEVNRLADANQQAQADIAKAEAAVGAPAPAPEPAETKPAEAKPAEAESAETEPAEEGSPEPAADEKAEEKAEGDAGEGT